MLSSFCSTLRQVGITRASQVAVALSGGPDSLALASLTARWQADQPHRQQGREEHPAAVALVVDHSLRPESAAEAADVAHTAAQLGLQPHVLQVGWTHGKPRPQDKLAAARDARYAVLLEACARLGCTYLLVAHHADDQAETFLLRLLHASGLQGLGCMPLLSTALSGSSGVEVVRPLLGCRKRDLEHYCQQEGLLYVMDPTNQDLSFARNRIRHLMQQQERHKQQEQQPDGTGGLFGQSHPGDYGSSHRQQQLGGEMAAGQRDADGWQGEGEVQQARQLGSSIVEDVLRLQRLCAEVSAAQEALVSTLLQQAVVLRGEGLHRPRQLSEQCQRQEAGGQEGQGTAHMRMHSDSRLDAVARHLEGRLPLGAPFAVCSVPLLAAASPAVCEASLSWLLGAVSGGRYPASTKDSAALARALCSGRVKGKFTGGGCYMQPVPGSKGALCVVAKLSQQGAVAGGLQGVLDPKVVVTL